MEDVIGKNNNKGDAIINHKIKLEPIQDLFSGVNSSEDEMDTCSNEINNTVIENNINIVSPQTV